MCAVKKHGVSSRDVERGGTRHFTIGGSEFGWSTIEDLYERDIMCIKSGKCSRVPKLKEKVLSAEIHGLDSMYFHLKSCRYMLCLRVCLCVLLFAVS